MDGATFEVDESISSVLPLLPGALGATVVVAGVDALAEALADQVSRSLIRHRRTGALRRAVSVKKAGIAKKRGYAWPGRAQVVMGDESADYGAAFEEWSESEWYGQGLLRHNVRFLGSPAARAAMAGAMRRQTGSLVRKLRGRERWRQGERRLAALDLDIR